MAPTRNILGMTTGPERTRRGTGRGGMGRGGGVVSPAGGKETEQPPSKKTDGVALTGRLSVHAVVQYKT